ncbi:Protein O-mannosyltransferase 2 [Coemansia sp. RSA 1813]|nr:Protein O-mannosyltransferase 2 [Coemansia sp. RSA 1646]KAJ1773381.1 Protein O-mannosyltransferase 2 [Coemansia sp. RSA 1843]KAJ2091599.1 Protein O-mannosyltransferase 2 [Coemansia sp. RSA 986]KAJ2212386.1 Protein O-mannosyltransferase 2 [Coemansia sp. RSA 487]KAJ2572200.1 Protein O-mannosyltransferase 2 [Coemansia sp. RSA 1813]
MSGRYSRKAEVFYDQRSGGQPFDSMHLPRQAGGFSAYPLDKSMDSPLAGLGRPARRTRLDNINERILVALLTLIACVTKMYRIGRRNSVSWDEAHFGKFGAYYLNRTFYHDVHPPLAKMLVGLSELLAGHNGTFNFKGGETYPPYVNYHFMRVFNASFGVALTPMAYLTCRQLRLPPHFAALAALCVTFDNALCVMSRFILLDAPLLGFTALALTMLAYFYRQRTHAFSAGWWKYLFLTGLSLGLVSSTKWVGFFAVALVGIYTIVELYEMFCNVRMPAHAYAKHWAARIVALIAVPLCVYALCFKMHFAVLSRYDGSANFMPMGFQVKLRGNPVSRQPYEIHTGSQVRFHSPLSGTGYLHSHDHKYPSGSQRQQITGYGFADQNNLWNIQRKMAAGSFRSASDTSATMAAIDGPIGHGDLVSLHHNGTDTFLYTDSIHAAPYSKANNEVSAVAADAKEAAYPNTLWVVEIVNPERRMDDGRIHPLGTPLRLRNIVNNCILRASGERLDKNWGWGQAEITCDSKNTDERGPGYTWVIERNINKNLKATDLGKHMSSSFVRDFLVLNRQMWLTNNALIPDHDKHNVLESDPASWPFMRYPMRMVGWDDHSIKYLEVGNPFLWWGSAVLCALFPVQLLYWLVRWQRQCVAWHKGEFRDYIDGAMFLWGGWALHYLPFFLMGRVTYLHHYLPALYFGILFTVYQIYHIASWYLSARNVLLVLYTATATVTFGFWWFSPLTYGWDKPINDLWGMQWASSWPVYQDKFAI